MTTIPARSKTRRSSDHAMGLARLFLDFLDRRSIFRRGAFLWMIWLTTSATFWCFEYAASKVFADGLHVAAVVAAVMAPIAALQGAIFKFYSESRDDNGAA